MDEATINRIREAAREKGIDPDDLLATMDTGGLPKELQDAISSILRDLDTFGQALEKLDDKES